jgi:hypothetical protein
MHPSAMHDASRFTNNIKAVLLARTTKTTNLRRLHLALSWGDFHAATRAYLFCEIWKRNKGFMSARFVQTCHCRNDRQWYSQSRVRSAQGEPLLSPHADECVRLAIAAGLNVHLNRRAIVAGSVRRVHSTDHRVSK